MENVSSLHPALTWMKTDVSRLELSVFPFRKDDSVTHDALQFFFTGLKTEVKVRPNRTGLQDH